MKIKHLTKEELLNIYPSHAYFDNPLEEIAIPDKDLLYNSILIHEYIHYLRRNRLTLKITSISNILLTMILGFAIFSIFMSAFIIPTMVFAFLLFFSYFIEENYIQKKMMRELNWEETISQINKENKN